MDDSDDDVTQQPSIEAAAANWRAGVFLAIAGTFLFALKSIFIKLAFAAGADAIELLTLRMAFSLPFYAAVWFHLSRQSGAPKYSRRTCATALLLGFLGYYLSSLLDLQGLTYISAQLERLTLFTYPAIIAVLAWAFLGEELNKRIIASIVLCYLGVALMYAREMQIESSRETTIGVLLVMGAAISYSLYILFAKPTMQTMGSRLFTSLAMMGSAAFVGLHFGTTRPLGSLLELQPAVYVYAVALAVACTVLPSYMISEAIMRIGATRTTVIGSVGPVLTLLLAISVLGEPTSIFHFLGMGVAVIGVGLVSRR